MLEQVPHYFPRSPSLQLTEGSSTHCAVQLPGRKSSGLPPTADEVAQPGDPEEQRPGTKEQEPCLTVCTYTLRSCTGQLPAHAPLCSQLFGSNEGLCPLQDLAPAPQGFRRTDFKDPPRNSLKLSVYTADWWLLV